MPNVVRRLFGAFPELAEAAAARTRSRRDTAIAIAQVSGALTAALLAMPSVAVAASAPAPALFASQFLGTARVVEVPETVFDAELKLMREAATGRVVVAAGQTGVWTDESTTSCTSTNIGDARCATYDTSNDRHPDGFQQD